MNAPITVTASGLRAAAQVRIVIDYENNAARWWGAAFKAREGCPESCRPLIAGQTHKDEVAVSAEDADAFRAWGQSLPGWRDGPEHAREPFMFHDA